MAAPSDSVQADDLPPEIVVEWASHLEPWEQAKTRGISKAWGHVFRDLEFWRYSPSWKSAAKGDTKAMQFFISERYNRWRDVGVYTPHALPSKAFVKASRYAGRRVTKPELEALLLRNLFHENTFDDQEAIWENITNAGEVIRSLGPDTTKLNLSGRNISIFGHFNRLPHQFPNLTHLGLGSWPFESLVSICMNSWPDLEELRCQSNARINTETWVEFFENHPKLKKLTIKLSFDHGPFDPEVVLRLLDLCPDLEELHITNGWGGAPLNIEGSGGLRAVHIVVTAPAVIEALRERMNVTEYELIE